MHERSNDAGMQTGYSGEDYVGHMHQPHRDDTSTPHLVPNINMHTSTPLTHTKHIPELSWESTVQAHTHTHARVHTACAWYYTTTHRTHYVYTNSTHTRCTQTAHTLGVHKQHTH